jgi:hypothetical protein
VKASGTAAFNFLFKSRGLLKDRKPMIGVDRALRRIPALAMLSIAGCVSGEGASPAPATTLEVGTVEAKRAELNGKVVIVRGFISKIGDLFFLAQGTPRSPRETGEAGETFWCVYTGQPEQIWVKENPRRPTFHRLVPRDIDWRRNARGRMVVIQGVLRDRGVREKPEEIDLGTFGEDDIAEFAVGPLERVRVLRILPELCGASSG